MVTYLGAVICQYLYWTLFKNKWSFRSGKSGVKNSLKMFGQLEEKWDIL